MRVIADLHVHSKYSRACSQSIDLEGMENTAQQKGITLLGTGDFTHPKWLSELKEKLEEVEKGVFRLKGSSSKVRFILSTEVATIYTRGNKSRRIHHCVMMPNFEAVDSFIKAISSKGNLSVDGRPILSISSAELVDLATSADSRSFIFPAHLWTPFYGALGQYANFNSLKEVYEDREKDIYAVETGLSSDPKMNWRVSSLDKYTLLSNSDMHSLPKMGREANVFNLNENFSYNDIIHAIKDKDSKHLSKTVEFYPEEGKYHYDGHRECNFSINPEIEKTNICPICGKPLVIGVLHRVNDLADRPPGEKPPNALPYMSLVPLEEIIAYVLKKSPRSIAVKSIYDSLIEKIGTEFSVLSEADLNEIGRISNDKIAEAILNVRENKIKIKPGYNGVFGKLFLLGEEYEDEKYEKGQKSLF